jgi:predicted TIM-barrel fold metal-dependent hydrolase
VRRIGMGLCPALWDVETNVKEIHWAKENGLKGLQLSHIVEGYDNYNHPKYDPMWAALEETGMVVNFHSGASQPYDQTLPGWVGIYCVEYPFWLSRPLIAMIFGGVFDRFPKLKVAVTEVGGDFWWPSLMQLMDFRAKVKKGSAKMGDHSARLKLTPTEYIRRNVWIGSSAQMDDQNYQDYHKIGIDRVMWGTDYPHPEGTWPYTSEQMHGALDGLGEADLEKVLGLNAVECFDLDVEALNKIAAKIGPLRSQFKQAA